MAGCDIRRHHTGLMTKLLDRSELKWICPQCLDILQNQTTADCSTEIVRVEVPRKREVAYLVLPVARLLFILGIITEALHYWH